MDAQLHTSIARAREDFLGLVDSIRPELHRYSARLTGSVIDGEDIVQDALAKAFYRLTLTPEVPPLRPWLFRITHNAALDFLRSHGKKLTDPHADMSEFVGSYEDEPDPFAARLALARFLRLPVIQRSAVILKDVLGHSLEETAETMETSVMAVKAALVRGRGNLRSIDPSSARGEDIERARLERYAALFNARDWDGVRALIGEDCRLDLVSKSQRRGDEVSMYFGRYAEEDVAVRVGFVDGRLALAGYVGGASDPSYFILLTWEQGRVQAIRDFRYVGYIADEAEFELK